MGHAWLLGNSRTRQNATLSSLKVSFNPHNEHSQFIYTAYDKHFDKDIEMASWRKENIQNQLMLWNKDWNLKGLL